MSKPKDERPFAPIAPNPFIVGNPVRDPAMFFGRQEEFELVRSRFQDSDQGGLLIFCGERRSGKTSILYQILQGRLGPRFIPVLIDMQSMAIQNEADFLKKIAREIRQRVDPEGTDVEIPDFSSSSNASALFHDFVDRVLRRDPDHKPILLFDEYELLETKIDAGVLQPDVLHVLSHLMEHYSVFMVFTGSEHLEQRRRDYWKFLGRALHKRISYLSHRDAVSLITRPVAGRVQYDEDVVAAVIRLTAGQPFYTQGICQVLIDTLNDERTTHATMTMLDGVVEHIVENPFPQMLFLWDAFERDEKIVLALLAEAIDGPETVATAEELMRLARKRSYPIPLRSGDVATALEGLFKKEFLLRDNSTPAGFSFRMDLWRLWTRRMHSVWQVVRELRLPRRRSRRIRLGSVELHPGAAVATLLALAIVSTAILLGSPLERRLTGGRDVDPSDPTSPVSTPPRTSIVRIIAEPPGADIYRDGSLLGNTVYPLILYEGDAARIEVRQEGYADSTFAVAWADSSPCPDPDLLCFRAAPGDTVLALSLRPLTGSVLVRAVPDFASISVDGERRGTGEVRVDGLPVPQSHQLSVDAPGYVPQSRSFQVQAGLMQTLPTLTLERETSSVSIVTRPGNALVRVGERPPRRSPTTWELPHGLHDVHVELDGHVARDTSITVDRSTEITFVLEELADGAILIRGDQLADIYIAGELVSRGNRTSTVLAYSPGTYAFRVYVAGGSDPLEGNLEVHAGELVEFNYSTGQEARRPFSREG